MWRKGIHYQSSFYKTVLKAFWICGLSWIFRVQKKLLNFESMFSVLIFWKSHLGFIVPEGRVRDMSETSETLKLHAWKNNWSLIQGGQCRGKRMSISLLFGWREGIKMRHSPPSWYFLNIVCYRQGATMYFALLSSWVGCFFWKGIWWVSLWTLKTIAFYLEVKATLLQNAS